ncbi:universal stress protein [Arthrobacter gyeryongensis]|uniref:Universal stress protein n=1 Tax=Arthrobacter gyeryongensis TaxID=1650592 RepID=A0ABP9S2D1_9MICC
MADNGTATDTAESDDVRVASSPHGARIVVGVDGSDGSLAAVHWAVGEARLRGAGLHLVMAWQYPRYFGGPDVWGLGMDPSGDSGTILAGAADTEITRLGKEAGEGQSVAITWEAVEGHPAEVLVRAGRDAAMLVVGSRGHGGFVGALLGSVSQHVVAHARCPVVLIPDPSRDGIPS